MNPKPPLVQPQVLLFNQPTNIKELALYIGTHVDLLKIAIGPERNNLFQKILIPKKNKGCRGQYRTVWEASELIADAYKSFARRFDLFARTTNSKFPHVCAYGYVRGKNTLDNARPHCANSKILHADIKDFFHSIGTEKIKRMYLSFGVKQEILEAITIFTTIDGTLPLGLPSSPLIANLVCLQLDDAFQDLALKYSCIYTRYADDITISGNEALPKREEIEIILKQFGFGLSERKYRVTKKGQAHYVTGLSVTDTVPRIPRLLKKRLRQELYYCKKYGVENHSDFINSDNLQFNINRIDGMVRYISYIEPNGFGGARNAWRDMLNNESLSVGYANNSTIKSSYMFYVDECEIKFNGQNILVLSIAKIRFEDVDKIEATTKKTLRNYIVDPFTGGRKEDLDKRGLHHSDSSEDLRKCYIDNLAAFPFKAYLIYKTLAPGDDYSSVYISLINKIFPHRLMSCENADVKIIFEENSKIKKLDINTCIQKINRSLFETNNRHPIKLDVIVGKKADHPCFSVPDFLAAIFANFATLNTLPEEKQERKRLFFENLRDKYRYIFDANNNLAFSRKRPFKPWN